MPFERYVDDAVCQGRTQGQPEQLKAALEARFAACGLELHAGKTRIADCKDRNRKRDYPVTSFTILVLSTVNPR